MQICAGAWSVGIPWLMVCLVGQAGRNRKDADGWQPNRSQRNLQKIVVFPIHGFVPAHNLLLAPNLEYDVHGRPLKPPPFPQPAPRLTSASHRSNEMQNSPSTSTPSLDRWARAPQTRPQPLRSRCFERGASASGGGKLRSGVERAACQRCSQRCGAWRAARRRCADRTIARV